jgi:hypothetical protein
MTTTVTALPSIMDPMYWLGEGGIFASAVLPGILVSTTPDDYGPLSTVVMSRFDGNRWVLFGDPITGNR